MDTKFWGPSGWQLLHVLAEDDVNVVAVRELFGLLPEILPCRFCRESAAGFLLESPVPASGLPEWLYELHNKVNEKLRLQVLSGLIKELPPVPAPSYADVRERYGLLWKKRPLYPLVGQDMIMAIAWNWTEEKRDVYGRFFELLVLVFPFHRLTLTAVPEGRKPFLRWVRKTFDLPVTFQSMCGRCSFYSSSCRATTCRAGKKRKNYAAIRRRLLVV